MQWKLLEETKVSPFSGAKMEILKTNDVPDFFFFVHLASIRFILYFEMLSLQ